MSQYLKPYRKKILTGLKSCIRLKNLRCKCHKEFKASGLTDFPVKRRGTLKVKG